jgi:magnesium transporter
VRFRLHSRSATKKAGAVPGSVVYVGTERTEAAKIDVIDYSSTELTETHDVQATACETYRDSGTVTWINVDGIHNAELISTLGTQFGISALDLEDIVNTSQRPKLDISDSYVFASLKMLLPGKLGEGTWIEQVSLVFGKGWLISFQETGEDVFGLVRQRLKRTVPRERFMTTDYLAYALIDAVVDNYFLMLEALGDQIESLEDTVGDNPGMEALETIRTLKRRLIFMRKAVWPLREAVAGLERAESKLIGEPLQPYLRDLYEHVIQAIDTIETYRDMVSGLLDLYHTGISNRMNEIMKTLTIFASIFIPLGFLAGVFGMNFDPAVSPFNMPELGFEYGYPMFWLLAIAIGGGLLWYFARKRWL